MDEIELGSIICKALKDIYFYDKQWYECHNDIALKLSVLKDVMRKLLPDKMTVEILEVLRGYGKEDIEDVLSLDENRRIGEKNLPNPYSLNVPRRTLTVDKDGL
jgi:hypothetical protein